MIEIAKQAGNKRGYRLTTELRLPVEREEVFRFFADAFQLERITPPWLNFSVLTPRPLEMKVGTLIDYKLWLHGVPIRWKTRISCWEPPFQFLDEQLRGPYRQWVHLHTFTKENGMTVCRDQVDYNCLGGPLVHWLFVERDLRKIFEYRHQVMLQIFTGQESPLQSCSVPESAAQDCC